MKRERLQRRFLLVAGVSLAVFIISVLLHNAVYGLFIHFLGPDFWERVGLGDEPVFFLIALASALSFAVGVIGSLVIFIRSLRGRA